MAFELGPQPGEEVMEIGTLAWIVFVFGIVILGLLTYLSYTPINNGEVGAVSRFGKLRRALKPGFNVIVPYLDKSETLSTKDRHREFPAEPEQVVHDDDQSVTPDEKRPFRITQKDLRDALYLVENSYTPGPDEDPLKAYDLVPFHKLPVEKRESMEADNANSALTSEIPAVVSWRLEGDKTSVENYLNNIDNSSGSRDNEVDRRLADAADRAIRELVGNLTAGHTVEMMEVINRSFQYRMEVLVGEKPHPKTGVIIDRPWGIHIVSGSLKTGDLGRTVNKARAEAAAARSRRQSEILDSEAEAIKVRNLADAKAHETRVQAEADAHRIRVEADAKAHEMEAIETAKGKGEGKRIKHMADEMGTNPLALELAKLDVVEAGLTAQGRTLFVPTAGIGQVMGVLGTAVEMGLVGSQTPPPAPPTDNTATKP